MHNLITPVNNILNQMAAEKSNGIPNELGKWCWRKKWLHISCMGISVIIVIPPHHHRPCLGNVTWDILVKNILPMGSANSNICGVPSEIPRKKCHMRKADKRTYRARDVERDGGYNKGRDLARFMLHVYKMTTALFCHYSGCAVLESDGEQCAG